MTRPGRGLAILAGVLSVSAGIVSAEPERSSCWDLTTPPGLFDWPSRPSVACRDGVPAQTGASATPDATSLAAAPAFAPATPETAVTFSGTAYVGVAVRF